MLPYSVFSSVAVTIHHTPCMVCVPTSSDGITCPGHHLNSDSHPEGHIFHIMHMHKLEHLRVSHCLLQSELLLRQHRHRLHPSTLKNRGRDGDADRRQRWPRLQQSRRAAARHTGPLPASEGGRHSCSVFGTAGCGSLKAHHCAPTRVILCKVCVIPRSWRPGRCTTGGAGALGARGCLSAPWATSQGWWS